MTDDAEREAQIRQGNYANDDVVVLLRILDEARIERDEARDAYLRAAETAHKAVAEIARLTDENNTQAAEITGLRLTAPPGASARRRGLALLEELFQLGYRTTRSDTEADIAVISAIEAAEREEREACARIAREHQAPSVLRAIQDREHIPAATRAEPPQEPKE